MDKSPQQVYATLLDDGEYLCSVRTMYRILDEDSASKERRNQLKRPNYKKPELLATAPKTIKSGRGISNAGHQMQRQQMQQMQTPDLSSQSSQRSQLCDSWMAAGDRPIMRRLHGHSRR